MRSVSLYASLSLPHPLFLSYMAQGKPFCFFEDKGPDVGSLYCWSFSVPSTVLHVWARSVSVTQYAMIILGPDVAPACKSLFPTVKPTVLSAFRKAKHGYCVCGDNRGNQKCLGMGVFTQLLKLPTPYKPNPKLSSESGTLPFSNVCFVWGNLTISW